MGERRDSFEIPLVFLSDVLWLFMEPYDQFCSREEISRNGDDLERIRMFDLELSELLLQNKTNFSWKNHRGSCILECVNDNDSRIPRLRSFDNDSNR